MRYPRSTVDDAVLALVSTGYNFRIVSKHWQDWSNTSNQPALYLKRIKENASQTNRGLNKYILHYELWIYAQFETANPNTDPYNTVVNPILDGMDRVLNPTQPDTEPDFQNLGLPGIGNARWEGDADIADGSVDGQILIVIPVSVYTGIA